MLDLGLNYTYNVSCGGGLVRQVVLRIEKMNLGSVFVGPEEKFWGVLDFNPVTMMVTLVRLMDQQLDEYCMRQYTSVELAEAIEVHVNDFARNSIYLLLEDAYYDYNVV